MAESCFQVCAEELASVPQAPGAGDAGPFAQSGFVDEDDGAVFSLGFFLSAGQPCRFHRMARFSGFWQEKPSRRSRCHKWPVLYSTPNCRVMTLPSRRWRIPGYGASPVLAPAPRRVGVAGRLSDSLPPSASCSHVATVCRATPSSRAKTASRLPTVAVLTFLSIISEFSIGRVFISEFAVEQRDGFKVRRMRKHVGNTRRTQAIPLLMHQHRGIPRERGGTARYVDDAARTAFRRQ
jgi:hypothetical protein